MSGRDRANQLLQAAADTPEVSKTLVEVHAAIWANLVPAFADQPQQVIDRERLRLARAVIHFARIGYTDRDRLMQRLLRAVRLSYE